MKKVLIWILVLVLVAVAAVVGTLAYLQATDAADNVMTVGEAQIEIREYQREDIEKENEAAKVESFENDKLLIPSVVLDGFDYNTVSNSHYVDWDQADADGDTINADHTSPVWDPAQITNEIDKMVFVKNTGECDVYVRLCFAFEAGNYVRLDRFKEMVHLNLNTTDWDWEWVEPEEDHISVIDDTRCFLAWATYNHVLPAGEHTNISLSQIALDFSAINDHAHAFGDKYEVKVFAQGIQADGFTSDLGYTPATALETGFEGYKIPFEYEYVNFTDLRTALHYLNADTNAAPLKGPGQKENHMVNSVTFGLTADHPEVVKNRDGVLVANEEGCSDFTAYAYYVSTNDGKYDVYVLADDWEIYAPEDCGELFYGMKSLTKVDTTNLNVSDTTSMYKMFAESPNLPFVDTTNWDVSSVERMFGMFQNCTKLNNIDVSGWNTTSLYDTQFMFFGCSNLTALDVSNWDVSNLTSASWMFQSCSALTYLNVSKWKVDKVTAADHMFHGCSSLQKLDVSDWKVNKVTSFFSMFEGCSSLTSLDVSKWTIDSANNTSAMFNGCSNLKVLDVSNFNVSQVTEMQTMFSGCSSLNSLDLSTWNTGNVTNVSGMFNGCKNLTAIYIGDGWNMGKVDTNNADKSKEVFKSCTNLPGCNGVDNIDASYAKSTAEGGYLTLK